MTSDGSGLPMTMTARDWKRVLARYRKPDRLRSAAELVLTAVLFIALWVATWLSLSVSYFLAAAFALPAAGCLVRLFIIQHDCGHGSFFGQKRIDDWVGRCLGVFTLTPYDVWQKSHAIHHASSGNLDKRGMGDIFTLTIAEYRARSFWGRLQYRLYRHPLVLFGFGPAVLFLIQHRLPLGHMTGLKYWISAMATNLAIATVVVALIYAVGAAPFLLVQLPITLLAASIGVWLFYVQHQFEDTYWAETEEGWDLGEAALYGSSHYQLPGVLNWFTGNIGIHHVHHLFSSIPHYRLPEVIRDHPELGRLRRLTMSQSIACVRLSLWDDARRKLVSFREAKRCA